MIKGPVQHAWTHRGSLELSTAEYKNLMEKKDTGTLCIRGRCATRKPVLYRVVGSLWAYKLVAGLRNEKWVEENQNASNRN